MVEISKTKKTAYEVFLKSTVNPPKVTYHFFPSQILFRMKVKKGRGNHAHAAIWADTIAYKMKFKTVNSRT